MQCGRRIALFALVAILAGCARDSAVVPLTHPPLIIAHRGASSYAPEHTLAAYDLAVEQGAHYLEQDLQLTADGVLVVLHDPSLDRTARGPAEHCTGRVADRTMEELRACEVGSWFNERFPEHARPEYAELRIPTLEEVIERYANRVNLYVETKNPQDAPGMADTLVALLRRRGLTGAPEEMRVVVQSFSEASLRDVHALEPGLPLVQLFRRREPALLIRFRLRRVSEYAVAIGPNRGRTTRGLIRDAHRRCLAVHPHTVNDTAEMRRLLTAGANGFFTDVPDQMRALLVHEPPPPFEAAREAAQAVRECRSPVPNGGRWEDHPSGG